VYYSVLATGGVGAWLEAAGGARVGSHVVRRGGDASANCRDAAFGRAALACADMAILHGVFVALFTASGLLFRYASLAELK
jgi:hypothetical protein